MLGIVCGKCQKIWEYRTHAKNNWGKKKTKCKMKNEKKLMLDIFFYCLINLISKIKPYQGFTPSTLQYMVGFY